MQLKTMLRGIRATGFARSFDTCSEGGAGFESVSMASLRCFKYAVTTALSRSDIGSSKFERHLRAASTSAPALRAERMDLVSIRDIGLGYVGESFKRVC